MVEEEEMSKAANEGQILALRRIRGDRTLERRVLVLEYREATNPVEVVQKIVAHQTQIDAIDRAIADEEQLTRTGDEL
jgi:hypothetical protein